MKYYVLLDTGIGVYDTDLLHDPIGQALLHVLRQTDGLLALPSVIREEIEKHALERCCGAAKEAVKHLRTLERLGGFGGYFDPPPSSHVLEAVKKRFRDLEPIVAGCDWTLEHAQLALRRVMKDEPPNSPGNQQYKDSLIWEMAVTLVKQAPVHFVTADKAFYESKQPEKGLSIKLASDIKNAPYKMSIYPSLSDCLTALTINRPELQLRQFIAPLSKELSPMIAEACSHTWISYGTVMHSDSKIQGFPVDDPKSIAIKFHLVYPAERFESNDQSIIHGHLHVFGATLAFPENKTVDKTQIHHIDFSSPQVGDGRVWYRVANEIGKEGPLSVDNPPAWILKKVDRSDTSEK